MPNNELFGIHRIEVGKIEETMPNQKVSIAEEILQCLYSYPFQAISGQSEKLEKLVEKEKALKKAKTNSSKPQAYFRIDCEAIVEEISQVIYDYLKRRPDDQHDVFSLIQSKAKDIKNNEISLEQYLNTTSPIRLLHGKTLRSVLYDKEGGRSTVKILRAFQKAVTKEQEALNQIKPLLGDYNLYNFDSVEGQQFQISNFRLRSGGESKLVYISIREKREEQQVRLELVGEDKLLIHFVMDDCRMFFYAHVGNNIAADIIQPVYVYNNRHAQPVASLAVMRRVPENGLLEPRRGQKTTGDPAIDRYLKHRAAMLTAQSGKKRFQQFDESDLSVEPGPFRRDAYHYQRLREREGLYRIYFCERYPCHEQYIPNRFFSTVGLGYLFLFEDAFGRLCAKMKTLQNARGRILSHEGWVVNDALKDGNYTILQLYQKPGQERAVNLFLLFQGSGDMYGSHNIMYDALGRIGSGAVCLQCELEGGDQHSTEQLAQAFQNAKPRVLLPTEQNLSSREQLILNYLSSLSEAHVSPVTSEGRLKGSYSSTIHTGIYKMYSYGKGGIRVGVLRIYPSGFVAHKSIGGHQGEIIHAHGKAQLKRQSLYLQLESSDNERLGFCVFKIEGEVSPGKGTVFTGTFCGVTRRNGEFPLASRLILEFVSDNPAEEKHDPLYVKYEDEGFEQLPLAVRQALKGRSESMIGFFKNKTQIFSFKGLQNFNDQEPDKSEAFLSAAVYELVYCPSSGGKDKAKQLLEKAKKYGHQSPEDEFGQMLQPQIQVLYERAAYQLIVKGDKKACLQHLQHARELAGQPLNLLPFEQAIGERQELFELKKMDAYRRLWG